MIKDEAKGNAHYEYNQEDCDEGDANPWLYRLGDVIGVTKCLKTRSLDLCFFIFLLKHAR
jgi:hypothetical protein